MSDEFLIANVSPVVGRHFVASSLNIARIQSLGPGAMQVRWRDEPTASDVEEYNAWVEDILGVPLDITSCTDRKQERARYEEWRRRTGAPGGRL